MSAVTRTVSWWQYLLLIPVIVFFALSCQKSYTGDEGLTVYLASGSYSHLLSNVGADFHVPGYYTALWLVSHIFGSSMVILRLFSLALVIAMIFIAIRHLSFPAALFLAISPFTLHLAVEIRMYSMFALLGLLLILAYRRNEKLHSKSSLIILITILSACTWVHYFGWIGTAAVVSLLLLQRKWMQSAIVLLSVILLFVPWGGNTISKLDTRHTETAVDDIGFPDQIPLIHRMAGMPLSVAGTTLRFASGTAAFNFDTWGVRSISIRTVAGLFLGILMLILTIIGFRHNDNITRSLILWSFLTLSIFRPSARHYAIAYSAYMITASLGLPSKNSTRKILILSSAVLMLAMCVPFAERRTIPQRCKWDRDFLQVATLAAKESEKYSLPVVLFLDTYSYLGIRMHIDEIGFPDSMVWYPHRTSFENGRCFFEDRAECVSYMQRNTDSLVSVWMNLDQNNRGFILVANNPDSTSGPVLGTGRNSFIGLGSDIMADRDLMDALTKITTIEQIDLSGSNGPLSMFVCSARAL